MSQKKKIRHEQIKTIVAQEGRIKIIDLAKQLNVTPETLRKDLNELEAQSFLIREHGYARSLNETVETPIELKTETNNELKKAVTLEAFKRINDGDIVFLDSSSTILTAISALQNKKNITVVTNSIIVAYRCASMQLKVIMAGGLIFNNGLRSYGFFTTEVIDHLQIDIAIMGTDAFNEKNNGFTTINADELGIKRHILNQSRKLILVCDSTKVNNHDSFSPYRFCSFNEFDEIITNKLTKDQYDLIKGMKKVTQV